MSGRRAELFQEHFAFIAMPASAGLVAVGPHFSQATAPE